MSLTWGRPVMLMAINKSLGRPRKRQEDAIKIAADTGT
jgi:hypothetical protein